MTKVNIPNKINPIERLATAEGIQKFLLGLQVYPEDPTRRIDYTDVEWSLLQEGLRECLYADDYDIALRVADDAVDVETIEHATQVRDMAHIFSSVSMEEDIDEVNVGPVFQIREIWNFAQRTQDRTSAPPPGVVPILATGYTDPFGRFLTDGALRFHIRLETQLEKRRANKLTLYKGVLPDALKAAIEEAFGIGFKTTCRFAPWGLLVTSQPKKKRWGKSKRRARA